MQSAREVYTHDYAEEHTQLHGSRTADHDAAFFLPLLRPGFRLLDCGCGPGSITVGLAQAVAPGQVVAIDIAPIQLETARRLAEQQRVNNIDFKTANIYELPFADATFDGVFAHNVLEHLRHPVAALREMWRVLRPGGVVGVRDDDWSAYLLEPMTPLKQLGIELILRVVEYNGGSFRSARFHAQHLREAGFVAIRDYVSAYGNGTHESAVELAPVMARQIQDPDFVTIVEAEQWADRATLAEIAAEFHAWGQSRDALLGCFRWAATGARPEP